MFLRFVTATAMLMTLGLLSGPAFAQFGQGAHPGYLHALSDLRLARWCLTHQPGDMRVFMGEDAAFNEASAAISDIQRASISDGKNLNDHPPVDIAPGGSRLLRAIEFLKAARQDVAQEEDNPFAQELRRRSIEHIDRALRAAGEAHAAWLQERGQQ